MKIAIPSFNRVNTLKKKTLKVLLENNIALENIYLFVGNEEQHALYKAQMPDGLNIITGVVGMCNIRNFMSDFFDDGEIIVYCDDDISKIVTKHGKTLAECFQECSDYITNSPYKLVGFPPTFNTFYYNPDGFLDGCFFCYGCFYIAQNDKTLRVSLPALEDYERTCLYYKKFGGVIRYGDILFKTSLYSEGGLQSSNERDLEKLYTDVNKIMYRYDELFKYKMKEIKHYNGVAPHIQFKKLKNIGEAVPSRVKLLPPIDPKVFEPLLEMLKTSVMTKRSEWKNEEGVKTNNRYKPNFPAHRSDVFGVVKLRPYWVIKKGGIKFVYSVQSKAKCKKKIYAELVRIGKIFCPFKFSSILVNNNTICGKHRDANNMGESMLISIGDYQGCNIVVEGEAFSAKYQPVIFNGSQMEHWNSDDLVGNKYSLVFYYIANDLMGDSYAPSVDCEAV